MRLIDADDLLEQRVYTVAKGKGFPYREAYKNMLYDIEHAPTVEAEPITHGHWIKGGETYIELHTVQEHICSICGNRTLEAGNFCGNCGAKMDESEAEE